ncbi:MAG: hypothetical protein V3T17_09010 [Pseudomonadales bacterium]
MKTIAKLILTGAMLVLSNIASAAGISAEFYEIEEIALASGIINVNTKSVFVKLKPPAGSEEGISLPVYDTAGNHLCNLSPIGFTSSGFVAVVNYDPSNSGAAYLDDKDEYKMLWTQLNTAFALGKKVQLLIEYFDWNSCGIIGVNMQEDIPS